MHISLATRREWVSLFLEDLYAFSLEESVLLRKHLFLYSIVFFFTELTRPLYFTSRLIDNENDILFPLATIALAFGSTAAGCTPLYGPYREVRPNRSEIQGIDCDHFGLQ